MPLPAAHGTGPTAAERRLGAVAGRDPGRDIEALVPPALAQAPDVDLGALPQQVGEGGHGPTIAGRALKLTGATARTPSPPAGP